MSTQFSNIGIRSITEGAGGALLTGFNESLKTIPSKLLPLETLSRPNLLYIPAAKGYIAGEYMGLIASLLGASNMAYTRAIGTAAVLTYAVISASELLNVKQTAMRATISSIGAFLGVNVGAWTPHVFSFTYNSIYSLYDRYVIANAAPHITPEFGARLSKVVAACCAFCMWSISETILTVLTSMAMDPVIDTLPTYFG